jgi:DnaJ-class molecular chaperone
MIARPGAAVLPSSEIRPEDTPERRLGALLLRMVREADARIPVTRRVPRTVAEMRQRIEVRQEGVCPACGGSGGRTETVVDGNGVVRQTWHPCTTCRGSGAS